MSLEKPPKILYKYRPFCSEKPTDSIPMLESNKIYFAQPLDFNDPFDCSAQDGVFSNFSPKSAEKFAALFGHIPPENITRERTLLLIDELEKHPEVLRLQQEQALKNNEEFKKIGILSLTERNDSILMWSHYADNHRGFCIGFRSDLRFTQNDYLGKVKYVLERENDFFDQYITLSKISEEKKHQYISDLIFFTKYHDWSYEKEWRFSALSGEKIYADQHIDSIIFGLRMTEENRQIIRTVLQEKKVNYFQAVKSKTKFGVDIVAIP